MLAALGCARAAEPLGDWCRTRFVGRGACSLGGWGKGGAVGDRGGRQGVEGVAGGAGRV